MTLVITIYVREGIVMAADSRLTLNSTVPKGDTQIINVAVGLSDSSYKLFLAPNNIGISTYGAAEIKGVPIAGFIESFINEKLSKSMIEVDNAAKLLLAYFSESPNPPLVEFHVAGYKHEKDSYIQQIWHVNANKKSIELLNKPDTQSANWGGEVDILSRLINQVGTLDRDGKLSQSLPYFPVPWQFFTIQDAIDFSVFAIRSTIDSIRFLPRAKTVGGSIDVLVIKPKEALWIQRKTLKI